jgi:hypothetical protein
MCIMVFTFCIGAIESSKPVFTCWQFYIVLLRLKKSCFQMLRVSLIAPSLHQKRMSKVFADNIVWIYLGIRIREWKLCNMQCQSTSNKSGIALKMASIFHGFQILLLLFFSFRKKIQSHYTFFTFVFYGEWIDKIRNFILFLCKLNFNAWELNIDL